jgi:O-acetyl-ADP-ribose deacetylase (regulator of RNase III)
VIKYVEGDITTVAGPRIVLHGCNCLGIMGAGAARAIAKAYPLAREVDEGFVLFTEENFRLGRATFALVDDSAWVGNLYTQFDMGPEFQADALESALEKVVAFALRRGLPKDFPIFTVKIGCGIGGAKWEEDVLPIFEDWLSWSPFHNLTVVEMS